jgi:hypothetical protein
MVWGADPAPLIISPRAPEHFPKLSGLLGQMAWKISRLKRGGRRAPGSMIADPITALYDYPKEVRSPRRTKLTLGASARTKP